MATCQPYLISIRYMTESQTHGIRVGETRVGAGAAPTNLWQVEDGIAERVKKQPRSEVKKKKRAQVTEERVHLSQATRDAIALRQSYCCNICKQLLPLGKQVDHMLALCHGGSNDLSNYQFLCANCHARKTLDDMDPDGYEHRTGRSKYFFPGPLFHASPSHPPRPPYDSDRL